MGYSVSVSMYGVPERGTLGLRPWYNVPVGGTLQADRTCTKVLPCNQVKHRRYGVGPFCHPHSVDTAIMDSLQHNGTIMVLCSATVSSFSNAQSGQVDAFDSTWQQ